VSTLEDSQILALFYARSEQAISELSRKYGASCRRVAQNILGSVRDAEECVNDAYLGVWNTIPPQRPDPLSTYLYRIVRNLAVTRYRANTAHKRKSGYDAALDELEGCLAAAASVEDTLNEKELTAQINRFLSTLDRESRVLFVRRYWYADSIASLAQRAGISRNHVSVRLSRIRKKLREYLRKEGYTI
jgi:RNA polymerase sigma-70 factor (ECF subfamily)